MRLRHISVSLALGALAVLAVAPRRAFVPVAAAAVFGALAVLVVSLTLVGTGRAIPFNHVSNDKDGDHLVDGADPQPNVYCGFAHADVGQPGGSGELDGVIMLSDDILGVISAYGTASAVHDQNHNDIVDGLDILLVVDHYSPGGYECSGTTPDPTPVSGFGGTSGPNIVHDGPQSLTGDEGSIAVTVSTAGAAPDPYRAFNIVLLFNTAVVQGTGGIYSDIVGGSCAPSFVNSGQGEAAVLCLGGLIPALPTTAVGPLMEFAFDVIGAGDPGFRLVCFGAPDNGGAFGGTYTVGADVAPQLQTVQGCGPAPTPTPTPPPVPVETVVTTIGTGGGSLSTGTGDPVETTLDVPAGALPGDVAISIEVFLAEDVPDIVGDALTFSRVFRFEPDGLTFDPPVTVTISYDESEFTGIDESTMDVLVYNSLTEDWEIANVIARDTGANTITISLSHFSEVIICRDGDDCDGDGCTNTQEEGMDENFGGRRDMRNKWDFYDVHGANQGPPDGFIDLFNDISRVIAQHPSSGAPYDAYYDRSQGEGPNQWNMGSPDGAIDLFNDISGVIAQAMHDCT